LVEIIGFYFILFQAPLWSLVEFTLFDIRLCIFSCVVDGIFFVLGKVIVVVPSIDMPYCDCFACDASFILKNARIPFILLSSLSGL